MKRKWLVWGAAALVVIVAVTVIAERQRAQRTVKYLANLSSDDYEEAADAMDGLVSRGGRVVPQLLTGLSEKVDPRLRWRIAEVLGRIKDPRAVEPLIGALKDSEPGVREAAAAALGKIRDPKAVQPMIAALQDEEASVRIRAALALAEFGDTSAVGPLQDLFQRSTPEAVAKAEAQQAKSQPGAKKEPAAAWAAEPAEGPPPDTMFGVREAVIRALGRLATKSPEALEMVTAALEDPHETVRTAACEALGQLRRKESTPLLVAKLRDMSASVATAAAWALAQIDDPAATDALKRAAQPDQAYWVRQAALEALERRGIRAQ